eukprot:CAMPEP_0197055256 /NCGR_PEP_ID=MMETSP1384-20130603/61158_1 /TAXON_ID=29189 /ORGANISM="Ammonia sp." /LENGTH=291 /DNA_ID=CAMNT_0042488767 /DNA_START=74 /DNA_END=946 /DNA_ORIENTATION=+
MLVTLKGAFQCIWLLVLVSICTSQTADEETEWESIRMPLLQGKVVMHPGNWDSNVCLGDNDRWDGGGFYLQNTDGQGMFVCPSSVQLVVEIAYGDVIEVSGEITSGPQGILTLRAENITKLTEEQTESIDVLSSFDEFENVAEYGDLVQIEGFVTAHVVTFNGSGSIFTATDCDGNTVKIWWTESIDDSVDALDLFKVSNGSDWQPSYFQMIGFKEDYNPLCWTGDRVSEFQPRAVDEIIEISDSNPCGFSTTEMDDATTTQDGTDDARHAFNIHLATFLTGFCLLSRYLW